MQETTRKVKDSYAQAIEGSGLRNTNQQETRPIERRFVETRQAKGETKPRSKPNDTGSICKGWVLEDQMTIKPSNAQARDTCKDESITQAQKCKNPNPGAREEQGI